MKFRQDTLGVRVILKPFFQKVSEGGILLVRDERMAAVNTDKGEVVMIGPAAWFDKPVKPNLAPGDLVMYAKWGAKVIRNEDQQDPQADDAYFILCNDEDILVGYEQ